MTITLKFNLPGDFFGDILDTALDTCQGYFRWLEVSPNLEDRVLSGDGAYTVSAVCRPDRSEGWAFGSKDNRNDWTLVDHAKIESAIQKIIDGELTNQPTRDTIFDAVCEGDTCNIDADCADAILQIAMFDEIVFG